MSCSLVAERNASIFRVEELAEKESYKLLSLLTTSTIFGLVF
jgi:hypothetical protein